MIILNTVRGLMVSKINFGLTCNEFYEKIKNNILNIKKFNQRKSINTSLLLIINKCSLSK